MSEKKNYLQIAVDAQARLNCATIRAMGMQAENYQREMLGYSMAYVEHDFNSIIIEYRLEELISDAKAKGEVGGRMI